MRIIDSNDIYSYILRETEWYAVDDAARNALIEQCKGAAQDRGRRYVNVFVEPEAVLSISPIAVRHCVWQHTFPLPIEDEFRRELLLLLREYSRSLGPARVNVIVREALG